MPVYVLICICDCVYTRLHSSQTHVFTDATFSPVLGLAFALKKFLVQAAKDRDRTALVMLSCTPLRHEMALVAVRHKAGNSFRHLLRGLLGSSSYKD